MPVNASTPPCAPCRVSVPRLVALVMAVLACLAPRAGAASDPRLRAMMHGHTRSAAPGRQITATAIVSLLIHAHQRTQGASASGRLWLKGSIKAGEGRKQLRRAMHKRGLIEYVLQGQQAILDRVAKSRRMVSSCWLTE
jgi:hypothetical protein